LCLCLCIAAAAVAAAQVHEGNSEAAEAAKQQLQWRQMITLTVEALQMPQLWFFSIAAFLWGEQQRYLNIVCIIAVHLHHGLS
jgi:hypothetical protein